MQTVQTVGQALAQCKDQSMPPSRLTNSAGMELSSPKKDVQIKGSPKAYTNKADSGHEVTRYFCDTCGS